jgi:hypothetical protein
VGRDIAAPSLVAAGAGDRIKLTAATPKARNAAPWRAARYVRHPETEGLRDLLRCHGDVRCAAPWRAIASASSSSARAASTATT